MKLSLLTILLTLPFYTGCERDYTDADSNLLSDQTAAQSEPEPFTLPQIDEEELIAAVQDVPRLSSFIFYQHGEIVHELYTGGLTRATPLNIKSASKNILSTLVGIAIEEGFIESVDDKVGRYLPEYVAAAGEGAKADITLRHLLTMSSGLRSTSFGNYGRWVAGRDWVAGAIGGEQLHPPGTRMRYSTGDTHILSAVITEATGMSTRAFAQQYLFRPINVRIGGWDRAPEGYYFGGNNMALSPGGLLSYGLLYLNEGRYNDAQVVPESWVRESLQPVFERISFNPRGHDYGYLWWSNTFGHHRAWFAWGYGGQYLFIIPELDAVIVFTGNPDARQRGVNNIIYNMMDEVVVPYAYHRN